MIRRPEILGEKKPKTAWQVTSDAQYSKRFRQWLWRRYSSEGIEWSVEGGSKLWRVSPPNRARRVFLICTSWRAAGSANRGSAHVGRTRKWALVAQEAVRLAGLGLSPGAIAKKLGVDRSTVIRWRSAGKIQRRAAKEKTPKRELARASSSAVVVPGQDPAEWAAAVRAEFQLNVTDDRLVTLAARALGLSQTSRAEQVRLSATNRFQSLVKQLDLVSRGAKAEEPPEPAPKPEESRRAMRVVSRPPGVDPRAALMTASSK